MKTTQAPKPLKIRRRYLNIALDAKLVDNIVNRSNQERRTVSNYLELLLIDRCPELMEAPTN